MFIRGYPSVNLDQLCAYSELFFGGKFRYCLVFPAQGYQVILWYCLRLGQYIEGVNIMT